MPSEPTLQDLLGFMEDDERKHYEAPERNENERRAILARLRAEWQSTPDPTLNDLKPPYMHVTHWAEYQAGSHDIIPFYTRQWKRQRRVKTPDPEPPEVTQMEAEPPTFNGVFGELPPQPDEDVPPGEFRDIQPEPQQKDSTETKSETGERQPTDDELFKFMSPKTKQTWARTDLTPQQRAQIWQGNKKLYRAAQRANAEGEKSDQASLAARGTVVFPTLDLSRSKPSGQKAGESSESTSANKPLPPRWFNRYWWFRKLMAHPRWAEGGGLVMAGVVFLKGLDWQIDGAIKTAALAFLVAWVVFSFAIYISSHWDKRRPLMTTAMILAAAGLTVVWYAYLPPPPQTAKPPSASLSPVESPAAEKKEPGAGRVFADVDPGYLVGLYKQYSTAQADQAAKTYIGKWIKVTGTVSDVTREDGPREPLTASVSILVEPSKKDQDSYVVVASFEDQASVDRALVLNRKEHVTVVGNIRRIVEPGILLEKCEFAELVK